MNYKKLSQILTSPIFIIVFVFAILMIITVNKPMNSDEGIWSYMGRVWMNNDMAPYTGAVENKSPGIFELYAVSFLLFGVNCMFVRMLGILAILGSMVLVFRIGSSLQSRLAGFFSMSIFGLCMTWALMNGSLPSFPETFMVFFSILSLYFGVRAWKSGCWGWNSLLAGLSIGFAIAFKQIAFMTLFALIFFFIFVSVRNNKLKVKGFALLLLASGVLISTIFCLIPLFFYGVTAYDYIEGSWLILLNPGSSGSWVDMMYGFFRVWFESKIVLFYPLLFCLVLSPRLLKKPYFIGLLIWLLFDFIGVNASGHYYGHQLKQLIPALALLAGILIDELLLLTKRNQSAKTVSGFVAVLILAFIPYQDLVINGYIKGYPDKEKALGLWIKEHSTIEDRVFVNGLASSAIMAYSERISPSKYFNTYFITSDKERNVLLKDIRRTPPKFFIVDQNDSKKREKVDGEFLEDYQYQFSQDGFDVYLYHSFANIKP